MYPGVCDGTVAAGVDAMVTPMGGRSSLAKGDTPISYPVPRRDPDRNIDCELKYLTLGLLFLYRLDKT